jgi:hypothetical protein
MGPCQNSMIVGKRHSEATMSLFLLVHLETPGGVHGLFPGTIIMALVSWATNSLFGVSKREILPFLRNEFGHGMLYIRI